MSATGKHTKFAIVGAGPTGLGAAYRFSELGEENYQLFEAAKKPGGLSCSFQDCKGFTWDIGVHIVFSHYEYYDQMFQKIMRSDFVQHRRKTWIRAFETWIPYPFQNHLRHLPPEAKMECVMGLIQAQVVVSGKDYQTFEDFVMKTYGSGICHHFMRPYNEKIWTCRLDEMSTHWISERVAPVNIESTLRNLLLDEESRDWGLNSDFRYPLFGGTGELFRRVSEKLPRLPRFNSRLTKLDIDQKTLGFQNGDQTSYDHLISTIPLDQLILNVVHEAPNSIRDAAQELRYSSGYIVGIGIEQPCPRDMSWIYFPDPEVPFYRVSYLSNFSPNMTPDTNRFHSLLCEISFNPGSELSESEVMEKTIAGLVSSGVIQKEWVSDIVTSWIYRVDHSYPIPTLNREKALDTILPWLEDHKIYSRGRFGMWCYEIANTDHSFMQGVEIAERLCLGRSESTIARNISARIQN